jgi:hypothetical protein
MDVDIVPAGAPGDHLVRSMQDLGIRSSKKGPTTKRKRSSRVVKSKAYVDDTGSDKEEVEEVPKGKVEEDQLMVPVEHEEKPKRKKKKLNVPAIDHGGVIPPEGSPMWDALLTCDRCRKMGNGRDACFVVAPGYVCAVCYRMKETCSRVPPGWMKLRGRRMTEREELMWKVNGIAPSPSVEYGPAKRSGPAARKVIEQSTYSNIFGPRSHQLGLKKSQKDEGGRRSLGVINEVCEGLVHQRLLA